MVRLERKEKPLWPKVSSATVAGEWYQVRLEEFRGNGDCECPHFECRLKPLLEKGAEPGDATRCKHILEARGALVDSVIKGLIKRGPGGGQ